MLNAMVWLARSGAPWKDIPERMGHIHRYTVASGNGLTIESLIISSGF